MSCRTEHFENLEREAKARHGDQLSEAMFEDLVNKIKEYAQQRRLEEALRKARGDPMDIGQLGQGTAENTGGPSWTPPTWAAAAHHNRVSVQASWDLTHFDRITWTRTRKLICRYREADGVPGAAGGTGRTAERAGAAEAAHSAAAGSSVDGQPRQ